MILTYSTIPVCFQCAFSNGGNLFAAVHGNVIQIYSTITFENVANLKGHNGKVKSLVWSSDDSKIVSCGLDGAVYEWETYTGKRVGESVLKSCHYTGVAVTPDGKTTFAVGSDKSLKEISDSQVNIFWYYVFRCVRKAFTEILSNNWQLKNNAAIKRVTDNHDVSDDKTVVHLLASVKVYGSTLWRTVLIALKDIFAKHARFIFRYCVKL